MHPLLFLISVLLILPLLWVGLQEYCRKLLYPRRRHLKEGCEGLSPAVQELMLSTSDGKRLHTWWQPREAADGVLVLCHGNAGNLGGRRWMLEGLSDLNYHILIFDYRGYGKSSGRPSEQGTNLDILAVWDWLDQQSGVGELPRFIYGRSLGGAVALQLASQRNVQGVILESTFTSILDIGRRFYPYLLPKLTLRHPYNSLERIRSVQAPILIANSPEDETVPFDMGEALAAAAPNLWKFHSLSGEHEDAGWQSDAVYAELIRSFLAQHTATV